MRQDTYQGWEAISLGYTCEVKYQISRHLYFRQYPDGSEHDFRQLLMTNDRGQSSFERHIFDWQITPFEAVLAYLEQDFLGVFDRNDLRAAQDGSGEVEHKHFKTRHPHDFHPINGVLDADAIDRQYEAARSKFDHLAEKFRLLIRSTGPKLYVFRQIRIYDDAQRFIAVLKGANPKADFKLLFVDHEGSDQNLTALGDCVIKAWTPLLPKKPAERTWEGDDGAWDAILAPLPLRLPGLRLVKTFAPEVGDAPPQEQSRTRSWLSRLVRFPAGR